MKKRIGVLISGSQIYYKTLAESIVDELGEQYPDAEFTGLIKTPRDVFKSDVVIISGDGNLPRWYPWVIRFFKKPQILYHLANGNNSLHKLGGKAFFVVPPGKTDKNYNYYPSPVFSSDVATLKRLARIWSKEKLVSKRGCIGIIGLDLDEGLRNKLAGILDLLVEDLDLNIIFIPILENDSAVMSDVLNQINFSANIRQVPTENYTGREILGIISKVDILITTDFRGAVCGMSANRPVIGLRAEESLTELLGGLAEEDILLDLEKSKSEEIYTKIKIVWVHRDSILGAMQKRINELRQGSSEGIRQLGKRIFNGSL